MQRRGTVLSQGFEMVGRGVTLVTSEAILRIDGVPLFHASVAMGFGEYGSSGDGNAACVALDEGLLLNKNVELHSVDKQVIRLDRELLQRGGHRLTAGLINVPSVDALGIDFRDGPRESMLADARSKLTAPLGSEFFRVVQTDNAALGIKNDRGGDNGTKERAAAGFIETGDAHPAKLSRRSLKTGRAETVHCAEILARRAHRVRSLITQRDDRIDLHGSASWDVICRERDDRQQKSDAGERGWVGGQNTVQEVGHEP